MSVCCWCGLPQVLGHTCNTRCQVHAWVNRHQVPVDGWLLGSSVDLFGHRVYEAHVWPRYPRKWVPNFQHDSSRHHGTMLQPTIVRWLGTNVSMVPTRDVLSHAGWDGEVKVWMAVWRWYMTFYPNPPTFPCLWWIWNDTFTQTN